MTIDQSDHSAGRVDRLLLDAWDRHRDCVAVEFEGTSLTYLDLSRRAGAMAARLRAHGVGPGGRVAVHLERSVDLVVALTGTMLAGGAHVALDVADPAERLRYMVQDVDPVVVVSEPALVDRLGAVGTVVGVPTAAEVADAAREYDDVQPDSPGYLVYTSGSTGLPKASVIPHRALASRLRWLQRRFGLGSDDRVLYNTACGFDVSIAELYWPLTAGATLVVARQGAQRDADYLADIIAERAVTTLNFVPSLLEMFLTARDPGERFDGVRRVLAGGEALSPTLVRNWNSRSTGTLFNMYGPSECGIYTTSWECPRDPSPDPVLIGPAVDDTELLVLDEELRPVEPGSPGELFVGGLGLALHYHRRPELTAERFVTVPGVEGTFYRSGDLVRDVGAATLQYLGRTDRQIKIRGFRIELGEIEVAGAEHPAVRQIAVVPTPEPVRLVAAVVPTDPAMDHHELSVALHAALAARLPAYMLPTVTVVMDALPVTPNGKLDQAAVLEQAAPMLQRSAAVVSPPEGELEQAVAKIWCDVLGVVAVDRHDDLFEIGCASVTAIKIARRIRSDLGAAVPIRLIFEERTVAGYAARLPMGASS